MVILQVMDIYPSDNILSRRPWIHTVRAVASSLHQCLNYVMNGMLITVKAKETICKIKNVVMPSSRLKIIDGNIHAFEIMNVEWVPKVQC